MSEIYELTAEPREKVGKGASRAIRRSGRIPAVIYGDKQPPMTIALDERTLTRRLHSGGFLTHVAMIDVNGEKVRVLPKDYQLHPVTDFIVHIDFLRVGEGAVVTLDVPVHFKNEAASPGLKRGGVLNVVRHAVECDVPVDAIPEFFEIDLTGLDIGDSIHISHVTLPEGVTPTITDRDFTIATIAAPAVLAAEDEAEDEAAAAAAVPADEAKKDEDEGA